MTSQEQPEKKQRKPKGRGHGEGSVFYRPDRDQWVAQVTLENGKKKQTYHARQKEAIAALRKMLNDLEQDTLIEKSHQTVGEYLQDWFENIQKQEVRKTTYLKQEPILRKVILPVLGHFQLQKLAPQHIQKLYADKTNEGWKPGSIRNIHKILHKAFKNAVRWKLVPHNVCDLVSLPRQVRHQARTLTKGQAVQLLRASQEHPLEPLVILALTTGMRHGEIAALRWSEINFEANTLEIKRTVTFISGHGYIEGEPKTEKSKRTIVLPRFVVRSLEKHRIRQVEVRLKAGSQWRDRDLVFCNAVGYYRNPATTEQAFHRLLVRAGLPSMRIHDLRHSAATLLIMVMKMPPNLVQELLGHDDIETTLGLYTHANSDMQREMMNALDELLGTDL
jgi:integrase